MEQCCNEILLSGRGFWWLTISRDTHAFVYSRVACAHSKSSHQTHDGLMRSMPVLICLWSHIAADRTHHCRLVFQAFLRATTLRQRDKLRKQTRTWSRPSAVWLPAIQHHGVLIFPGFTTLKLSGLVDQICQIQCCQCIWKAAQAAVLHLVARNQQITDTCCAPTPPYQPGQIFWLSSRHNPLQVDSSVVRQQKHNLPFSHALWFIHSSCIYVQLYTVSHKSDYTPHISANILLYLFIGQHWR